MANGVFNIAKGRVIELHNRVANNDPANSALVIVLIKVGEADAALEDYDNLNLLLGAVGNTEADFTNYTRKVLTNAVILAATPDDTNNWQQVDLPDQTWSAAGGALNNTMVKMIVCYDDDSTTGNDTNLIPLTHHDFTPTTNGNDLVLNVDTNGYHRST